MQQIVTKKIEDIFFIRLIKDNKFSCLKIEFSEKCKE